MSSSKVANIGGPVFDASSTGQNGGEPDWDRIDADIQKAFESLQERVAAAVPGSLSKPGRASAPAFALFSDRVFYRADLDAHDPVLVGVTIVDQGSDEPFVDVTDAQGRPVAETGSRRGLVSGTFFHAIARES